MVRGRAGEKAGLGWLGRERLPRQMPLLLRAVTGDFSRSPNPDRSWLLSPPPDHSSSHPRHSLVCNLISSEGITLGPSASPPSTIYIIFPGPTRTSTHRTASLSNSLYPASSSRHKPPELLSVSAGARAPTSKDVTPLLLPPPMSSRFIYTGHSLQQTNRLLFPILKNSFSGSIR